MHLCRATSCMRSKSITIACLNLRIFLTILPNFEVRQVIHFVVLKQAIATIEKGFVSMFRP